MTHKQGSLLLVCFLACMNAVGESGNSKRPNLLIILADDLGFSDLGCFGGEIQTPHLDGLAANGLRFTQFYNTARCWPTRAALLTGYYAQQVRRDAVPGVKSGGGGTRPKWAPLLPRMLQTAGYRSYHSGKWHLDGMPLENGFDKSYYLKDQGRFFNPKVHWLDDKKLPEVPSDSGYYGTTAIADHAIECLRQHSKEHADQPFFHYLAFTAPHFPLHALPEDIEKYKSTYQKGWDEIRKERWMRLQALGVAKPPLSQVEPDLGPPYHFPDALEILGVGEVNRPVPWDSLNDAQKAFQSAKMAVHAAMVDRMDQEIGRVLDQIRQMGAMENTLILFLSDNGASAEIMVRSDGHDPSAAPGSAASYLCLGPGWSTACNTPFRKHKTWVHEGGCHTACIMHWPEGIPVQGRINDQVAHVIDVVPTLLELTSGSRPRDTYVEGHPEAPGVSLLSVIQNPSQHLKRPTPLWWLHEGNRAIRDGDWKAVAVKDQPWELFNLGMDPNETKDLAGDFPDQLSALSRSWQSMESKIYQAADTQW